MEGELNVPRATMQARIPMNTLLKTLKKSPNLGSAIDVERLLRKDESD